MGYFITNTDGSRSYVASDGVSNTVYKSVTGVTTLTEQDSGKTILLNAAAGAAITLPATAEGLTFKFITKLAFATTDWTIVADAAVIYGVAIVGQVNELASAAQTITFGATADTVGDYVILECDGTNWYVSGAGNILSAITFS